MTFLHPRFARRGGLAVLLLALGVAFLAVMTRAAPAQAQGPSPSNAECQVCHSNPDLSKTLPSGEPLSLYVDEKHYNDSVHGQQKLTCVQCHTDIKGFPHPAFGASDRRDVTMQLYSTCKNCHEQVFVNAFDSIHGQRLLAGNRNAPVCVDCHTAHAVTKPDQPRARIPQTCAQCHSTIFDQYAKSVHGVDVLKGDNPDVPTCIDCHGVHSIPDPTTNKFRLRSPQICAQCHTDKQRMAKYNISTDVLNTYVADFHGTTVELFEKQSPDQPTNKPVCYDCHGIHDIKKVDDPESRVFSKENLLKTCQQCHPDANEDSFTSAWMSHYIASPDKYPLVYYINLFYWILVPGTVGALAIFIGSDIYRQLRRRSARPKI